MSLRRVLAVSVGLFCAGALPASAQGLTDLHTKVRVGNKICFSSHYHDGSGSGNSRKGAEADAVKSWQGFTGWEYGSAWGNFWIAEGRGIKCEQSSANAWSCHVQARACRRR